MDMRGLKYLCKMCCRPLQYVCFIWVWLSFAACSSETEKFVPKEVFHNDVLVITQIAENTFIHTSFKQTQDFENVPCNGAVMRNQKEVVVFDTPTDTVGAELLMQWINEQLHAKIVAVVPTHFHDDFLGGLEAFHQAHIPSIAQAKTPHLADSLNHTMPNSTFATAKQVQLGDEIIELKYFGPGHTADNIVGYFAHDRVLFGGCLIKEIDASKGYLGDAHVGEWSATVQKIKQAYPDAQIVIPGHGAYGDRALLDYTISLFSSDTQIAPK